MLTKTSTEKNTRMVKIRMVFKMDKFLPVIIFTITWTLIIYMLFSWSNSWDNNLHEYAAKATPQPVATNGI